MPTVEDLFISSIRKYGIGVVNKGETLPKDFPRIPTGIYSVDYALGGGFPVGVASCLYGPPGGGKSLVLQKAIACAQQLCWKCFEYKWDCTCTTPTEQKVIAVTTEVFDPEWAKCLGVDLDNLIIAEPEYGEQAGDIISEALRSTDCGLVCLDSLAMLTPMAELEASFEDFQVAAQARLISKMMRVIESRLVREKKIGHKIAFMATNHIRSKIGQAFGNPEEVPGGWAAKHTWHLTVRMSQLSTEATNKGEDGIPVNAKFKASTVALSNKRKIFMLQGAAEFYCTMKDQGEFIVGDIPDFKTVEKAADEIEFIGRSPWSILGKEYDKKSDLIKDWHDREWYLSVKKKLIDEYRNMAKMEMGME